MSLLALDPSFRRTGISVYSDGEITINSIGLESNPDKSFHSIWHQIDELTQSICNYAKDFKVEQVISEIPPPVGQYSAGLWALDSVLFHRIRLLQVKSLYVVPPNYIAHIHGTRKYTKTDSVELAKSIMEGLSGRCKITLNTKRLNHDQCESFLFFMSLVRIK